MDAFDWAWPKRIDRAAAEAALHLEFLAAGRNLVLVAAQGLGKTLIAQNIAHQGVPAGHHVLFTTAAQLLLDLGSQDSARGLARRLTYTASAGSPSWTNSVTSSYDARTADLLFQVVSRRYERGPMITSNQNFGSWGDVFGDRIIATAILDRILHHAITLNIRGNSYRLKDKLKARPPQIGRGHHLNTWRVGTFR